MTPARLGTIAASTVVAAALPLPRVPRGRAPSALARAGLASVAGGLWLRRRALDARAAVAAAGRALAPVPDEPGPRSVAIVVTAHDEAEHLGDCIRSVRAQAHATWECVVVDDASTDDTVDVAWDAAEGDPRVRVLSTSRNVGLSAARNVGLAAVDAPWVTFLDGDDFLLPDTLGARLAPLVDHEDAGWCVGSTCQWVPVEADARPGTAPPSRPALPRITWLDVAEGPRFVASSPVVRTDAARAVGGFDETLVTAEDVDFWDRLLRGGWFLEPVDVVGVAYRQRPRSMFRRTPLEHARTVQHVQRRARRPGPPDHPGPGPWTGSVDTHRLQRASLRRTLVAAVGVVDAGLSEARQQEALDEVAGALEALEGGMLRALDVRAEVAAAARRLVSHTAVDVDRRARDLERRAWRWLGPTIGLDERRRVPTSEPPRSGPRRPAPTHAAVAVELRDPDPATANDLGGRVWLAPESAYHLDELEPLGRELQRRGHDVVSVVSDRRHHYVAAALRRTSWPLHVYDHRDQPVDAAATAAAVVVMNDWSECRAIVRAASAAGRPTFGKVEGAQDFEDVDVPHRREPYRTVDHVLLQGAYDAEALRTQRGTVVGSSRLERLWSAPEPEHGDVVVVNANFTYGVLEDAADAWLDDVVGACADAGLPHVVSAHPAASVDRDRHRVARAPMRHLLVGAGVLVSRFSTVPLEAMARGVPFVYFNPHGERVPMFADPEGAFGVAHDRAGLARAVREATELRGRSRERSRRRFLHHVSIDPDRPSHVRSADVVEAAIRQV